MCPWLFPSYLVTGKKKTMGISKNDYIISVGLIISSGFLACPLPVWHCVAFVWLSAVAFWTQTPWCLLGTPAPRTRDTRYSFAEENLSEIQDPNPSFLTLVMVLMFWLERDLDTVNSFLICSLSSHIRRASSLPTELITTWGHICSLTYMSYISKLGFHCKRKARIAKNWLIPETLFLIQSQSFI